VVQQAEKQELLPKKLVERLRFSPRKGKSNGDTG